MIIFPPRKQVQPRRVFPWREASQSGRRLLQEAVQSRQGRLRLPPERAGLNVTELFSFLTDAAAKKAAMSVPG
jgi:hypothetical protein